jgi:hypothetical protein
LVLIDERTIFVPMIPESVFFKNQNDPRIRGLYAEMPILGGCTSTSCMNILHNQAMICIIKVSYWGAFPNSARLFCIYIIVALHIFPNFDFFSRPYLHKALNQAKSEGLILSNPAEAINLPRAGKPQIEILTRDEQARLVQVSYHHRYGVFIRLVLMTGIRLGELLGLQWCDIDFRARMLHIRRTLNRLQKRDAPTDDVSPRTEIVIQEPKTENSVRDIPLLAPVVADLLNWRKVQEQDHMTLGEAYMDSGFIVTNPQGNFIEPRTFSD